MLVSFKDEILPQRVSLGFMVYHVKHYVWPPLRCFKWQRFGHVAAVCRVNLENSDPLNLFFSMKALLKAKNKGGHTAPGKCMKCDV